MLLLVRQHFRIYFGETIQKKVLCGLNDHSRCLLEILIVKADAKVRKKRVNLTWMSGSEYCYSYRYCSCLINLHFTDNDSISVYAISLPYLIDFGKRPSYFIDNRTEMPLPHTE